jgi:hypothetical protein
MNSGKGDKKERSIREEKETRETVNQRTIRTYEGAKARNHKREEVLG